MLNEQQWSCISENETETFGDIQPSVRMLLPVQNIFQVTKAEKKPELNKRVAKANEKSLKHA